MEDTVVNSATGHLATLRSLAATTQLPGQQEIRRENLQRDVVVTGRLEGSDLGSAIKRIQSAVNALHLPRTVRVTYGGTYEEQQKSFAELTRVLILALVLVFGVLLAEFRNLSAPIAILASSVLSDCGSGGRAAHHRYDLQRSLLYGPHHGHRHRRQERDSSS